MKRLITLLVLALMFIGAFAIVEVATARPASATICIPFSETKQKGCHNWWDNPTSPGVGLCKDAPAPEAPGRGLSGIIDSGPTNPSGNTVYETVQYPPQWHTYDLGCTGSAGNPGAVMDTTIGNWLKGMATVLVALCASLHRYVSPPKFLNSMDGFVTKGSQAIHDALFIPWIGLSLLVLGIVIMWSAHKRHFPTAVTNVLWAIIVLGAATALFTYPIQASHIADNITTATVGQINSSMLGESQNVGDPSSARAALLTDNVLYRQWCAGEVGSADSKIAQAYCMPLLKAQTYTYGEQAQIAADPSKSGPIATQKEKDFKNIASAIQEQDPGAYECLKTGCGSRMGMGALSLIAAIFTTPFMIMADLLIIIALVIERLLVVFAPGVAPIALHMKSAGHMLIGIAFLVIFNSIGFAAGAAVNALMVGVFLGSNTGLPIWMSLILCGVLVLILWGAMRPLRKLTSMTTFASMKSSAVGAATLSGVRRHGKHVAAIAGGAYLANRLSHHADKREEAKEEAAKSAVSETSLPEAYTRTRWEPPALPPASPQPQTPGTSAGVHNLMNEHEVTHDTPKPTVTPENITTEPYVEPASAVDAPAPRHALPEADEEVYTPPPAGALPPSPGKLPHGDIYGRDEVMPEGMFRADPMVQQDGDTVFRIWDPSSKSYEVVQPNEGGEGEGISE